MINRLELVISAPTPERSPSSVAKGFKLNRAKCAITSLQTINEEGRELYGAFIGAPEPKKIWLEEKIERTLTHVRRLGDLRSQDALILLRQCIVPELAHLLRCMDLSDMEPCLAVLDEGIEALLDRLRGGPNKLTEVAARRIITTLLFHLPVRHNGVGIMSFQQTREAARGSFLESNAQLLQTLVKDNEMTFNRYLLEVDPYKGPKTQRQRMETVHVTKTRALIGHLNPLQLSIFGDQQNKLHKAWMTALPTSRGLRLNDRAVGNGLRQSTLMRVQEVAACNRCGEPSTLNHQETCSEGTNQRTYRHDALKRLLENLLTKGCPERLNVVTVEDRVEDPVEDAMQGAMCRTDLRIIGKDAPNETGNDTDVTFTAVTAYRLQVAPARLRAEIIEEKKEETLSDLCIKKRYDYKMNRYNGKTLYPFVPLVFTTGGSTDKGTAAWLKELSKEVRNSVGRSVRAEISVLLLRYSTRICVFHN